MRFDDNTSDLDSGGDLLKSRSEQATIATVYRIFIPFLPANTVEHVLTQESNSAI
jgi:hypothetical protein